MKGSRKIACVAAVLLWASGVWAQEPGQPEARALFGQALDLALPRDTAPVAHGDTRMTLRVVPPSGHESQVIFLLHGKTTTAEAMQAVSVRQAFGNWMAAGQAPELNEWAKTVPAQKANFEVTPQMRTLLDGWASLDFKQCEGGPLTPNPVHYELWVETDKDTLDIHAYTRYGLTCPGLAWMQQVRQAVRQQVPQLEVK